MVGMLMGLIQCLMLDMVVRSSHHTPHCFEFELLRDKEGVTAGEYSPNPGPAYGLVIPHLMHPLHTELAGRVVILKLILKWRCIRRYPTGGDVPNTHLVFPAAPNRRI